MCRFVWKCSWFGWHGGWQASKDGGFAFDVCSQSCVGCQIPCFACFRLHSGEQLRSGERWGWQKNYLAKRWDREIAGWAWRQTVKYCCGWICQNSRMYSRAPEVWRLRLLRLRQLNLLPMLQCGAGGCCTFFCQYIFLPCSVMTRCGLPLTQTTNTLLARRTCGYGRPMLGLGA